MYSHVYMFPIAHLKIIKSGNMPCHYQLRYKCKAMYVYNGLHVYLVKVASNLFTFYLSFLLYYLKDKT